MSNLPAVINAVESLLPLPSFAPLKPGKAVVIVTTKEPSENDLALLASYGKVVEYDDSVHLNLPFASLQFDYLIIPLDKKTHRIALQNEDLSLFNVVCFVNFYEKSADFIAALHPENVMCNFPKKMAFKADFDKQLLTPKLNKPNGCLNVVKMLFSACRSF